MRKAWVRPVSDSIADCELTHMDRVSVDAKRAGEQHGRYIEALRQAGCVVELLVAAPELPDAVFVEDTALVLDEVAVLTRPGAASRRPEVESVGAALGAELPLLRLEGPATLDGGDVLRQGNTLWVGLSARSNPEGHEQLSRLVAPHGFAVKSVEFSGALHLKTAACAVDAETILLQPEWVQPDAFPGCRALAVHPDEPFAANVLRIGDKLIMPRAHPRTAELCAGLVQEILPVPAEELAKAEGGVTCCSLILDSDAGGRSS